MFKRQWFGIAVLTVLSCGLWAGELVFESKTIGDFRPDSRLTAADGVFAARGAHTTFQSKKAMKLRADKKYQLSGEFRNKSGKPVARLYVGLVPLDAAGKRIIAPSVHVVWKSETALARPAEKGSKILYVKDASKWNIRDRYCQVAFNAKEKFADLPNRNLVKVAVVKPVQENGVWKVTLANPLPVAYPADTAVRLHRDGDNYIYAGTRLIPSDSWQSFKGVVSGKPQQSGIRRTQLWPGTAQVRFLVMGQGGGKDSVLEFRNMKIEALD